MKYTTSIMILAGSFMLASPALAQYGPGGIGAGPGIGTGSNDESVIGPSAAQDRHVANPGDPEGNAEDLRMKGHCDKAIPIFRRLTNYGAGFELAQYNLGLCMLDIARAESDPTLAANLKQDGAKNIIAAADRGLAKAQVNLVTMYLDGTGVERDPVQAGMWALIYHNNGARIAIGLPNITPALQARLDGVLNAQAWQQAETRAEAWAPHS